MVRLLCSLTFAFIIISSCKKNNSDCVHATVIQEAGGCTRWYIKIMNDSFPSANIPDEFKKKNLGVCINYTLYQDPKLCICCGGTWADIKTIKKD